MSRSGFLEAVFFFIFSTIEFVFECSDFGPDFFGRCCARLYQFTSPRIIFWKSNGACEKELIFCDGSNNIIAFGEC